MHLSCLESVPSSTIQYGEKLKNARLGNLLTEGAKAGYSGRILLTPTKSPQRMTEVIIKMGELAFSHSNFGVKIFFLIFQSQDLTISLLPMRSTPPLF